MSILNVGTYPPKQCGIATFSMDLRNSLSIYDNNIQVMAVSDNSYEYSYPDEVIFNIKQDYRQHYIRAAKWVNGSNDIKLVIIQHEYGIYGGNDGEHILEFSKLIDKPYIVITHTVLPHPSKHQKLVLYKLCHGASGVVCMTKKSRQLLIDLYSVTPKLIHIIGHGVPVFKKRPIDELKLEHNLEGQQTISTFGLIGPGKGLELGIQAVARIIDDFPSVCYLILGQTHPMLKQSEGEKYRQMLESMVMDLKLESNVRFINKYLSDDELGDYLYMTDIYLSPYPNKDQAVSGTMAFAMGCGRAIVSTSYAYAVEVLAEGRGLLSESPDPEQLASLMSRILSDAKLKRHLQTKAYDTGKSWSWPSVGKDYDNLFYHILKTQNQEARKLNYAGL